MAYAVAPGSAVCAALSRVHFGWSGTSKGFLAADDLRRACAALFFLGVSLLGLVCLPFWERSRSRFGSAGAFKAHPFWERSTSPVLGALGCWAAGIASYCTLPCFPRPTILR